MSAPKDKTFAELSQQFEPEQQPQTKTSSITYSASSHYLMV
jgi:hypothetical protein